MSEIAARQMNLFTTPKTAVLPASPPGDGASPASDRKKNRPVRYPDIAEELALNDLMVSRRQAEADDRNYRKAQGLPKKVKTEAERAEDRQWQERWLDACRRLALRGHQPLAFPELLEEVRRRSAEDPVQFRRETDRAKLDTDSVIFLNLGVGQDSVCMTVLAALGLLPDWMQHHRLVILFSDVMCERPSTYAYLLDYLIPFMERYGLEFMWLKAESHYYGLKESVPDLAWLEDGAAAAHTHSQFHVTKNRVLPGLMDIYMSDTHPSFPMWSSRARCNGNSKHGVLARARDFVRQEWNGRKASQNTAQGYKDFVLVGIANDETGRAEPTSEQNYVILYPLIAYGLGRAECLELIEAAGLPQVEKSGCVGCFASPTWERWYVSQIYPFVFRQLVLMEQLSVEDRLRRNLAPNYIDLEYNLPLAEAVAKFHEENPSVTVEQCAEWLVHRTYNRDEKPKRCPLSDPNQLTLDGLDDEDIDDLLAESA